MTNPVLTYQPEQLPRPGIITVMATAGVLVAAIELLLILTALIWAWRGEPMSAQEIARYGPLPAERLWGNIWLAATLATAVLSVYLIRGSALVFRRSPAAAKVLRRYASAELCVTAIAFKAAWISLHWPDFEGFSVLIGWSAFALAAPIVLLPGIYAGWLLLALRSRVVRAYYAGTVAPLPVEQKPAPIPSRRRRVARLALPGILLVGWILVPAGSAREEERPAWRKLIARQQNCWAYTAPPDSIVCNDDPAKFQELLAIPGFIRVEYKDPPESFVGYVPSALRQFRELFIASPDLPIAFLHERQPFGAAPALVIIQVGGIYENGDAGLEAWVAPAAQLGNYQVLSSPAGVLHMRCSRLPGQALTFTAGQPDPVDPSHFTIGYQIDDGPGVIDGWLAKPDTVMMRVRSGPAKRSRRG